MVLRSKSVGEQDVADQQGAFCISRDASHMGGAFFVSLASDIEYSHFEVFSCWLDSGTYLLRRNITLYAIMVLLS